MASKLMRGKAYLKKQQLIPKLIYFTGTIGLICLDFLFNRLLGAQAQIPDSPLPERIISPPDSPLPERIIPLTDSPLPERIIPPQRIIPPPPQSPPQPILPPSQPLEDPLILPSTPATPLPDSSIPSGSLTVTQFIFVGNTVFSAAELGKILVPLTEIPLASVTPEQPLSLPFTQLLQIANQVADYYAQQGYSTSGAVISIPQSTQQTGTGAVTIRVIEGKLEQINVALADQPQYGRLGNYVRSRLGVDLETPLNVNQLLTSLQLLQLDPLVQSISAQLSAGSELGKNILNVSYRPANSLSLPITLDNGRSPSIGSFERGISLEEKNLLGLGDQIRLGYANTDGSDRLDFSYAVPFNSDNGTVRFNFTDNENQVIEPPFDDLNQDGKSPDITSNYQSYDLSLIQPIIRSIDNSSQTYSEFSLGFNASWRSTQSFLFGQPFPFALSADINGNTRLFALRFSQEFIQQNPSEVFALRSEFSFGLNAFGSTVIEEIPGIVVIPDSQFFSWRGQIQYVQVWQPDFLFLIRSNIQLADSLLPLEQFSIGGLYSVRGYRQDQLLTDNGLFLSVETHLPLFQTFEGKGNLKLTPFIDYGVGWNANGENPSPSNLVSVGFGLLYRQGNFTFRLDWGIPLVNVPGEKRTWQENGLYFTLQYSPF